MSTDKNNGNDGFTVGSKDYSTDLMYPFLLPFLANSPNLSRLLVNADVSDVAVSKLDNICSGTCHYTRSA